MRRLFRRLELLLIATVLAIAAFSTGLPFLFYLVYLAIFVVGGSYVLTRLGLSDLEAGYSVSQLSGHVGDRLQVTYTVRNTSRMPKPWLEIHNPTSLPAGLPGRAIGLGAMSERSWLVRTPLTRRGHFRIEPLQIQTGDPFGLFRSSAAVGSGVTAVVYPRVDPLPLWSLPPANVDGSRAMPDRTLQTSPLATTVRPWAPGDAFNRIHWKSTARHGEIQVKEFELEQTADAWIILDLEQASQLGLGDDSTIEVGVRAAASVADKAIAENRAVGLTVNAHRLGQVPPDRGGRQRLKVMQLLAAVEGDGGSPLSEALISTIPRIRRGTTVVIITPSLSPDWVRPLVGLRSRGVGCVAVTFDLASFDQVTRGEASRSDEAPPPASSDASTDDREGAEVTRRTRELGHALAEFGIGAHTLVPGVPLGNLLAR
ncbi:MAG: DUF58 domain-containing protein [Chloroflexota bacterium]